MQRQTVSGGDGGEERGIDDEVSKIRRELQVERRSAFAFPATLENDAIDETQNSASARPRRSGCQNHALERKEHRDAVGLFERPVHREAERERVEREQDCEQRGEAECWC